MSAPITTRGFFTRWWGEYDPKLEGIWWVEETGMSCNVYYLAEGRTLIDAGNFYGLLHELSQEFDISLLENLFLTPKMLRQDSEGRPGAGRSGDGQGFRLAGLRKGGSGLGTARLCGAPAGAVLKTGTGGYCLLACP